jgi:hypothetical protein
MTFLIVDYYALWNPTVSNGNWFATQPISGSTTGATETQNWFRYDQHLQKNIGPLTFVPGSTLGTQEAGSPFGKYFNVGVEIGANTVTLADYLTPLNGPSTLVPTTIAPVDPIENSSFGIILGFGTTSGATATLIANDVVFAQGVTIENFHGNNLYKSQSLVGEGTLLVENIVTNDGVILNQGGGSVAVITAPGGTFVNNGTIETSRYTTVNLGNSVNTGGIFNYSSIYASGGEIVIGSSVYGNKTLGVGQTGTFAMGNAGTFILNAPINGSEYIQFTDGNGDRLGVNTSPTLFSGATVGFHLPPIGGFADSVTGSPLTQSANMITLNSSVIQGEITGYSIVTGKTSQTLLLDENLNGTTTTLALSFAGTTSLDHLTIAQANGTTALISGGADFFSGPTSALGSSANFFNPVYWDLGATPGSLAGTAINSLGVSTPINAPRLAEIAGASVYLSSTATSFAAPTTLSNMTIGLLGSVSNGVTTGGTLNLYGVDIGATSTIITGIGHNLIDATGSVVNYGTIEAAGTSAKDGVAINTGSSSTFTNAGLIAAVGGLDPATIGSYGSPATTFINNGTLEANGTLTGSSPANAGELVINDYITASTGSFGTILMANGGIIELNAGAAANQSILFGTHGGTLDLSTTADVAGGVLIPTLTGFGYLSNIDLTGSLFSPYVSESLNTTGANTTLVVSEGNTAGSYTTTFSLVFAGHPQNLTFTNNTTVTLDGVGQSAIVITAPCFAAGTRILTERGEIPVQALAIGDVVITIDRGTPCPAPVRWLGQRHVPLAAHPAPERVAPIVIDAGALGNGIPHRSLTLSPDHALLIDGLLIEAKYLVNGATIRQDFTRRAITYHHVELDRHSAILAEGAAAETYVESGNRHQFEGQPAIAMIADFAATQPVPRFAPLCNRGPAVTAIRQRLAAIAISAGYRITHASAANPSGLMIEDNGQIILGAPTGAGRVLFNALAPLRRVRLRAPSGVPAEIDPAATDRRRLSLALRGLAYGTQELALDERCFAAGFYAPEGPFRWAGPEAILDFAHLAPSTQLTLLVHDLAPHWQAPLRQYPLEVA